MQLANKKRFWLKVLAPVVGVASLIWFLVRVLPKPSRAAYPCQQAAFPLASGFVVWLAGLFGTRLMYRKSRSLIQRSRYAVVLAALAVAAFVVLLPLVGSVTQPHNSSAIPRSTSSRVREPTSRWGSAKASIQGGSPGFATRNRRFGTARQGTGGTTPTPTRRSSIV